MSDELPRPVRVRVVNDGDGHFDIMDQHHKDGAYYHRDEADEVIRTLRTDAMRWQAVRAFVSMNGFIGFTATKAEELDAFADAAIARMEKS